MISAACREVARPILFAIGIIILVFVPLFTLQGVEGKTFRPLAYTVALAMLGSLIFAIGIAPMLSSFFMKRPKASAGGQGEARMVRWLIAPYKPVVRFFVNNRWAAVVIAVGLLAVGAVITPRLGSEFTPRLQEGTIVVRCTMVPSIALTESEKVSTIVERRLMKIPEVREVVSRIGRGEVGAHTDPVNSAEIYVILHPQDHWRTARNQADIEDLIRHEVGNVPAAVQVKLLRALQERAFERVGGSETLHVDIRLVAATNLDLEAAMATGRFREDLFYRLNVVPITVPCLKERREDIPLLIDHLLPMFQRRLALRPEAYRSPPATIR